MVQYAVDVTPHRDIALSGGVMMNGVLGVDLARAIEALGLRAMLHRSVPPNDGGIALGQAVSVGR